MEALLFEFLPVPWLAALPLQWLSSANLRMLAHQAGTPAANVNMLAAELMEQGEETLLDHLWTELDHSRFVNAAARFGDVKTMHRAMAKCGSHWTTIVNTPGVSDAALLDLLGPGGGRLTVVCTNSRSTKVLDRVAQHVVNPTNFAQLLVDYAPVHMVEHALALPELKGKIDGINTLRHLYDPRVLAALRGVRISPIPPTGIWKMCMHDCETTNELRRGLLEDVHLDNALLECFYFHPRCFGNVLKTYDDLGRRLPVLIASDFAISVCRGTSRRLAAGGIIGLCCCGDLKVIKRIIDASDPSVRDAILRAAEWLLLPQVAALAAGR